MENKEIPLNKEKTENIQIEIKEEKKEENKPEEIKTENNNVSESIVNEIKINEDSNKGNALQYFTNIRKEIFTKIDTLNKQIQDFNKNKIIENKKQKHYFLFRI